MNFLNPIALFLGLLAGLIVLMYLLKLRRKREDFSSTLLWIKSIEDLIANAPFQKLRRNLLMYLQILLVLLLAFALARPMMWLRRTAGARRLVLIDNTASMNARDAAGGRSRLEAAKGVAKQLVGNMRRGDQMMIVSFGGAARVVQPLTGEQATLRSAIDRIEPTDARARIREALLLAQGVRKSEKGAVLDVISDGGIGYLGNLIQKDEAIEFYKVGASDDNRGITSFDIRGSFERRDQLQAFAEVENFSDKPADILLRCLVEGKLVQAKEGQLKPHGKQGFAFSGLAGGQNKTIRLELAGQDMLEADNAVQGLLNLDATLKILLVSRDNFFLERALALLPGARVAKIAPAAWQPTNDYGLIVFDQFAPPALGPGRYLFINAVPPLPGFKRAEKPLKDQLVLDWNRLHPVTRFLSLDALAVNEALDIIVPDWIVPLIESASAPLVMAGSLQRTRLVCIAFDIYASDWPLQVSFPVFVANAAGWLVGGGEEGLTAGRHLTGETIALNAAQKLKVKDPRGRQWELTPGEDGLAYFNQTLLAGMYEAREEKGAPQLFAANLLAPAESDIAPKGEIITGERKVEAVASGFENREIWRWLLLAGLLVMVVEWHIYCRRSWA